MILRSFPALSRMRWRRLDTPGREEARIERRAAGWRLGGELDVEEGGLAARLRYTIDCDLAWLRFPSLRLELLEQTYTCQSQLTFRYHALVDGEPFTARLDIDALGRVIRYQGLWEAEPA